jgi:hypothetical protein
MDGVRTYRIQFSMRTITVSEWSDMSSRTCRVHYVCHALTTVLSDADHLGELSDINPLGFRPFIGIDI